MIKDIQSNKFQDCLISEKGNYYIIGEGETTDDDIYDCNLDPPESGDKYILIDNKLVRLQ